MYWVCLSFVTKHQMQFKGEGGEQDLHCLQNYSQEEKSLLNSRRRMNCEASERSSQFERQNQEEINQFKREIEQRFKLSIANKLYTFPKVIRTISDLLSSSESEDQDAQPALRPNGIPARLLTQNFKKKSRPKESPAKQLQRSYLVESVKKGKDKLKTTDSTNKRRDLEGSDRDRHGSKLDRTHGGKKKQKAERAKQQPSAFLQTIRNKMGKR